MTAFVGRQLGGWFWRGALLVALLALGVGGEAFGQSRPTEVPGGRLLHYFDFDERRLGNREDLPMHWVKLEGPGLPHYVNGRLVTDVGRSSGCSFRFDLNGGGLIYRTEPSLMPVSRGGRYRVQAFVKTTQLENARARMSVTLYNELQQPIASTTHHSDLFAGNPGLDWTPLRAELKCDDPRAAFIAVDLELLQPSQYAPLALGARTLFNQDVTGSAWFTDISVLQVPEVTISAEALGNVFPRSAPVRLRLHVSDQRAADLTMRMEILDGSGKLVYQRSGPLEINPSEPGIEHVQTVSVPEVPAGWYQARIVLLSAGHEVAWESQNFIQLADEGQPISPDARFGVSAAQLSPAQWEVLPKLLPLIGAGRVKVTAWSEGVDIGRADADRFDHLMERLQDGGIVPTACITGLPADAAGPGVLLSRLPRLSTALWQPRLSFIIARHASHLDRWQFGADSEDRFATDAAYRKAYDVAYDAFKGLMRAPDVAIPWPATFEPEASLPSTVAIAVPPSVLPEQIPLYVQDTKDRGGKRMSVTLLPLGPEYGREVELRDYAERLVMCLAGGAERVDVPLPFTSDGQPSEEFVVLRTTTSALVGATYRGRLNFGDRVEAVLFERAGRGIIAMWTKASVPESTTDVRLNLGGRPMMVDLFGNVTPLRPAVPRDATEPDAVTVSLGSLPVFIDGVDPGMALFRVSVGVDNPMFESSVTPQMREVSFTNTTGDYLEGTVRIEPPTGWTVSPGSLQFGLNPGEKLSRQVQLSMPYNSVAGTKTLKLSFALQGTKPSKVVVPVELKLGLADVGLQSLAIAEGGDVVVQMFVTNYGQKPIEYNAFALCPGQPRQERLISALGPGRTAVKRFRFPIGEMSGKKIRVGLREIGHGQERFLARGGDHPVIRFEATRDDLFGTVETPVATHEPSLGKPLLLVAACALIDVDNRVLLARRPEGKKMAGLWEFPGGKLNPGETPERALIRELKEELGIDVSEACLAPFAFASHDYDRFHLLMPLFLCRRWKGTPSGVEGQALAWVRPNRLTEYDMPAADKPLIPLLRDFL